MADPLTWCPDCKAYGHIRPVTADGRWCPNDPTHQGSEPMSPDGAALIAAERQRQVEQEGWTPEHDAAHDGDDLARAATAYLTRDPEWWPWGLRYWKPIPADRVRELVKAGALIAAEIDRLQRADAPASRLYTEAGHRRALPGFSLDATEGAHE